LILRFFESPKNPKTTWDIMLENLEFLAKSEKVRLDFETMIGHEEFSFKCCISECLMYSVSYLHTLCKVPPHT
jgi:hypothetical protein